MLTVLFITFLAPFFLPGYLELISKLIDRCFFPTVPPVIMYAPEEMTVLELNAVTLTCVAEGDPAPATTWIKEGHSVHSSDRVHLMSNGSLVCIQNFCVWY